MQKRPKIIKEKKIYKNIYELNIDLKFNKKTKFVKENFIFKFFIIQFIMLIWNDYNNNRRKNV